jgi:catechol 2,3-dioxygenase-like lactoylglutathione lyase family enzyme
MDDALIKLFNSVMNTKSIVISGIQQIGIGVPNVNAAWKWYRENFGVDIRVFEESAVAALMLPYTGGQPQSRHAALAVNLQGGGGFEIWQYTGRTPVPPSFEVQLGDFGIFSAKIKAKNVNRTWEEFHNRKLDITALAGGPDNSDSFFVRDPYKNLFQIVEGKEWFREENKLTGASYGAIIGVSDIENARKLYSDILGFDQLIYEKEGRFEDFSQLPGGNGTFKRILLASSSNWKGSFSPLLGPAKIELVQALDRTPHKIFENRFWGDLGFIHLCFDIHGMLELKEECTKLGFPFTVDSATNHKGGIFDMGESAGHFSYIEDPDGTLIEFVETHKVPIAKRFGIYLNMSNRDPRKSLPRWMIAAMRMNRIK